MSGRILILSAILACLLIIETGCVSSGDPNRRSKRVLAGASTSSALGVATGVGGPILLARAALGATSRMVTGEATDKFKESDVEETEPAFSGAPDPSVTK